MIPLLKESLIPLYRSLRWARWREFYRLHHQLEAAARFEPTQVRLFGQPTQIPDGPSLVWQYKDIFVDEVYYFEPCRAAPIILDCGANLGLSCLYFSRTFAQARIVAYEADPYIAEFLARNLNAHGLDRVELIPKAVWIDDDGVSFVSQGADGGSVKRPGTATRVPSTRLRSEIEKFERIDLLKMGVCPKLCV